MPKTKPTKPLSVTLCPNAPPGKVDSAAQELGCQPADLKRLLEFIKRLQDAADDLRLVPPEVINGALTMLASAIDFYPEHQRANVIRGIYNSLMMQSGGGTGDDAVH